ncbi:hypothetical protein L7F22_053414 [Adiantum nelumboides]|nr:hypothetical protein [Adiantum nelumboides]
MDEAMARVEARRKELADARAAKAAKIAKPTTMEKAKKQRLEKAKALQKERKRLEVEKKAQEEAEKIEKEKHIAEQRAAQLAREKIKEALSRKAKEPILEPSQGSPKRPRQEDEEEMEHIQADSFPSSPMNIPLAPPSSSITPYPPASTPRTPPSPTTLIPLRSPPAPASPQQQQPSAEPYEFPPSTQGERDESMERIEEEKKQADTDKPKLADKELQIPLIQLEEPTHKEAYEEVKIFDYTKIILTLSRQFKCQHVVAKETDFQKERADRAYEEVANLKTALELTTHHEAKVKQLELELKAKTDLELQKQQIEALNKGKEAVESLASTSQISQAETHLHIKLPPMPKMPDFPSTQEEEQQRPIPGALDIIEEFEQEIEGMPEGPAKEYLLYEKKVMESAALAFLQPEEQRKEALVGLVNNPTVLAIFINNKLVGDLNRLMAMCTSGNLIPLLKEAGAVRL